MYRSYEVCCFMGVSFITFFWSYFVSFYIWLCSASRAVDTLPLLPTRTGIIKCESAMTLLSSSRPSRSRVKPPLVRSGYWQVLSFPCVRFADGDSRKMQCNLSNLSDSLVNIFYLTKLSWAHGGVVVNALRYTPAGCGFNSQWCHWIFSET
jgi:hypothetical protein